MKQIEHADAQATAWLSMHGFSPSDRARLGITSTDQSDPFRELHEEIVRRRAAAK